MKVLLLDNFDSFTYNLFHLVDQFDNVRTDVLRNDEITADDASEYDRILISPGPGIPAESGCTLNVIKSWYEVKPILGICLGLQAITEALGGRIYNMDKVFHGISRKTYIVDEGEKLFHSVPSPFLSGHYHSWAVDKQHIPAELKITASDEDGIVMAMSHKNGLLKGVQFHPESILTEHGKTLISNWLFRC